MSLQNVHQKPGNQKVSIHVVGAGLAGSECALQLADLGYKVELYEMRNKVTTAAHQTGDFAELVCSNSFGSLGWGSAPAQLKWEAQRLRSEILKSALFAQVPAGQALGMDRQVFAKNVTEKIKNHKNITIHEKLISHLQEIPRPAVIATGPLTEASLANSMQEHFGGDFLYFFDAIAPIIDFDSINFDIAWKADRYDKGTADYINCPLDREQYQNLISEIQNARKIEPKHFETTDFFEGCMPIEVMVDRGPETLRFGPMKPVGLKNPKTGKEAHAIVQLRQDNKEGTAFNMVGFQTRMAYSEQVRVFRMIPGLENAEFLKLGSMHRNLFINTPTLLNKDLSSKKDPWLFFAGQITGVEGYFESTCIGILVSRFLNQKLQDRVFNPPPRQSAMGSLLEAITDPTRAENFQPTNINFGLFPHLTEENGKKIRDKKIKKLRQLEIARQAFTNWAQVMGEAEDSAPGLEFLSAPPPPA